MRVFTFGGLVLAVLGRSFSWLASLDEGLLSDSEDLAASCVCSGDRGGLESPSVECDDPTDLLSCF